MSEDTPDYGWARMPLGGDPIDALPGETVAFHIPLAQEQPSWDDYFLMIAAMVAKRSTCVRRHVGAVVVRDRRILTTGYNGAPTGVPHCTWDTCPRVQQNIPSGDRLDICRGVHAEMNALLQGAWDGVRLAGATLYCTNAPCFLCTKAIINAGIVRVRYSVGYPDDQAVSLVRQAGFMVVKDKHAGGDVYWSPVEARQPQASEGGQ